MTLQNETDFEARLYGLTLASGAEAIGLAVKGTWKICDGEPCTASETPEAIRLAPEYAGEPGASSLLYPSDATLPKPGTDCLLIADAVAPYAGASVVTVRFQVGPVASTLLAFGERRWERSFGLARPSDPAPFERLPLRWEHAFGGGDPPPEANSDTPASGEASAANPLGMGFRQRRSATPLAQTPPPRIERHDALVASPDERPEPAGVLPVAPNWAPRVARAGTYDEAWQRERAPLLPDDFDARFSCVAPDDLTAIPPLVGGEAVRVEGVRAESALAFTLPRVPLAARAFGPDRQRPLHLSLSTVIVEPDPMRLTMTWNGAIPLAEGPLLRVRVWPL